MPDGHLNVGQHGRRVTVKVGVSAPQMASLLKRGLSHTVGPAQRLELLIDTSADATAISEQAMRGLGITPVAQTRIHTSTTVGTGVPSDVYAVEIALFPSARQPFRNGALEVIVRIPLIADPLSDCLSDYPDGRRTVRDQWNAHAMHNSSPTPGKGERFIGTNPRVDGAQRTSTCPRCFKETQTTFGSNSVCDLGTIKRRS